MIIVFISNSLNHHEKYLCDELNSLSGVEFYFIQTIPLSEERKRLGWSIDITQTPYCICFYEERERCEYLIDKCDALIIGGAPFEYYKRRLKEDKLSFFYCESFFKQGYWHILNPKTFLRVLEKYIIPSRNEKIQMLCASAFTAKDCSRIHAFKNRCFRWGHFIEVSTERTIEELMHDKQTKRESRGHVKVLWVGRFLQLKHPEMAIMVAKDLRNHSIEFELEIVGTGPLEDKIKSMIDKFGLGDCVHLRGAMSPEEVRKEMGGSDIFLFTSDHNEGWGAVLGEAMSAGCAVVTSSVIGATPFLVQNNINGYIYNNTDYNQFANCVLKLTKEPSTCIRLGTEALATMRQVWAPSVAAKRFTSVVKNMLNNQALPVFSEGPMSNAPVISRQWFNSLPKSNTNSMISDNS